MNVEIRLELNPPVSNEALNALFSSSWTEHKPVDFRRQLELALAYVCAYDAEHLVGFVKLVWDGGVHAFLLDTTVHAGLSAAGHRQTVGRAGA